MTMPTARKSSGCWKPSQPLALNEPQDCGEQPSREETKEAAESADTAPQGEPVGLTVEIPLDKVAVGNLTKLLDAKGI